MQSYLDLSLLAVIGGAVLLLILILVSFLISNKRSNQLEAQIGELLGKAESDAAEISRLKDMLALSERKLSALERTANSLTDANSRLEEKLSGCQGEIDKLSSKIEQQNRVINENTAETQPIYEAARMLRRGATMDEVVAKTKLPRTELEMLSSVHGIGVKTNPPGGAAKNTAQGTQAQNLRTAVRPQDAQAAEPAQPQVPITATHVASLRARNAYGMPQKGEGGASLRRPR